MDIGKGDRRKKKKHYIPFFLSSLIPKQTKAAYKYFKQNGKQTDGHMDREIEDRRDMCVGVGDKSFSVCVGECFVNGHMRTSVIKPNRGGI